MAGVPPTTWCPATTTSSTTTTNDTNSTRYKTKTGGRQKIFEKKGKKNFFKQEFFVSYRAPFLSLLKKRRWRLGKKDIFFQPVMFLTPHEGHFENKQWWSEFFFLNLSRKHFC
jgi:hypothetical protein